MNLSKTCASLIALITAFAGFSATSRAQETVFEPGADVRIYAVGRPMQSLPTLVKGQTPNTNFLAKKLDFEESRGDFKEHRDRFLTMISARLLVPSDGKYEFRLTSDDGSRLEIDGKVIVDHDGLHGPDAKRATCKLKKGQVDLEIVHFEELGGSMLRLEWRKSGEPKFRVLDESVLSTPKGVVRVTAPGPKRILAGGETRALGDRRPLAAVHPAYRLTDIRPEGFQPKVGGMAFRPDGKLAVCTWSPEGGVYLVDGALKDQPEKVTAMRIAAGLAEPLGLTYVGKRLFVLQKQELTELIDHDGDELIDEYRVVADGWSVSDNFHEFAFGLVEKDGWLHFNLAIAINPGGASTSPQVPDRGRSLRVNIETGEKEFVCRGLRTPNGIGLGVDDEVFITDNQGDWLPASKLVHLKKDAFYNSFAALPKNFKAPKPQAPVVWLPQNEIGNSPSQPGLFPAGPFAGQMLHGDVTHGGLKRVFVEKVRGNYQGAVFRFTQGLEAGVNRIAIRPDGTIFVGGVGSAGNWQHNGKRWYGLQRLSLSGESAFEMHSVSARSDGFVVTFTEPIADDVALDKADVKASFFRYKPTKAYGGPKLDEEDAEILDLSVSTDRRQVFLRPAKMKPGQVFYLRLPLKWRSVSRRALWSTEAWYTLNALPKAPGPGYTGRLESKIAVNTISEAEARVGWRSLFDGEKPIFWRGFKAEGFPSTGWEVREGELRHLAGVGGGDIITRAQYHDFEFSCQWKVAPGGNSGIMYRVSEEGYATWSTGPEMQVLDNALHPDGADPKRSAGALYALIACNPDPALPPGEWNEARIRVKDGIVEHYLNGYLVVRYGWKSPEWYALKAKSKFKDMPGFGEAEAGHIALQDHGDLVAYRNLKIRRL